MNPNLPHPLTMPWGFACVRPDHQVQIMHMWLVRWLSLPSEWDPDKYSPLLVRSCLLGVSETLANPVLISPAIGTQSWRDVLACLACIGDLFTGLLGLKRELRDLSDETIKRTCLDVRHAISCYRELLIKQCDSDRSRSITRYWYEVLKQSQTSLPDVIRGDGICHMMPIGVVVSYDSKRFNVWCFKLSAEPFVSYTPGPPVTSWDVVEQNGEHLIVKAEGCDKEWWVNVRTGETQILPSCRGSVGSVVSAGAGWSVIHCPTDGYVGAIEVDRRVFACTYLHQRLLFAEILPRHCLLYLENGDLMRWSYREKSDMTLIGRFEGMVGMRALSDMKVGLFGPLRVFIVDVDQKSWCKVIVHDHDEVKNVGPVDTGVMGVLNLSGAVEWWGTSMDSMKLRPRVLGPYLFRPYSPMKCVELLGHELD